MRNEVVGVSHKIVSHGGACAYCGGSENVIKYRRPNGETYRVCDPCESAAAAARQAENQSIDAGSDLEVQDGDE